MDFLWRGRRYRLVLRWPVLVAGVLLLPLLVGLGFWQLDRAGQKRQWLQEQRQHAAMGVTDYLALADPADPQHQFQRVSVAANWVMDHTLLLDNRMHEGRVGYRVIMPVRLDEQRWLLVDRGWLPAGPDRRKLPRVPPPNPGLTRLVGQLRKPYRTITLAKETWRSWPRRVQGLDLAELARIAGHAIEPWLLTLQDASAESGPDVQPLPRPVTIMSPARHTGYAVQWFTLAGTLLILLLVVSARPAPTNEDEPDETKPVEPGNG